MRRVWLSLVAAAGLALAGPAAAETHPFSVHDMLAMDRISDPRVSPDGKLVAFAVSVTDLGSNKRRSDLYLAALDGSWVRRLTAARSQRHTAALEPATARASTSCRRAPDRAGVAKLPLDGGEAEQVTEPAARRRRPRGVAGRRIPCCSRWRCSRQDRPSRPRRASTRRRSEGLGDGSSTGCFVRHWDTWEDGTRNHLFVYPLAVRARRAT